MSISKDSEITISEVSFSICYPSSSTTSHDHTFFLILRYLNLMQNSQLQNQVRTRYTDTSYVIYTQWHRYDLPVAFPIVHQYLRNRLAQQKQHDQDAKVRLLKSEPLLSERKQRRRKSRSLERQRSRRSANNVAQPNGIDTVDSSSLAAEDETTTDEDEPRASGSSAVIAEVYHRVDSSLVQDDETSSTKTVVNRFSGGSEDERQLTDTEDFNRNRTDVPDRNIPTSSKRTTLPSPVVLRRQFFAPISESSTSCDDDERSVLSNSDYATVQFINQVSLHFELYVSICQTKK